MKKSKVETRPQRHIIFLGDGGVGKTALASSLCGRNFEAMQSATHGINHFTLNDSDDVVLIDFSGQEIYREEVSSEIKELNPLAAIIAISARAENSVPTIERWEAILRDEQWGKVPKFLVITQSDTRNVNIDGNYIINKFGFNGIYKTSAKEGTGVTELREALSNVVPVLDKDDEIVFGEIAAVVRIMIETLCEMVARNPNALQAIEWRDLERLIAVALEEIGFTVMLTESSKDGGKDVIANCTVRNEKKTFYIEIKHWRKGGRPGGQHVSDFVEVNAKDKTDGGLFISSSGFGDPIYGRIGELLQQKIRLGDQEKIVSLCKYYVKKKKGIWQCSSPLPEVLFADTLCAEA